MEFGKYFDHTILSPDATADDVDRICAEAKEYNFASVCVNSTFTSQVAHNLTGTGISTCVVVGFPLGASDSDSKAYETKKAVENGADEIDMVINIGALKGGEYDKVLEDIKKVRSACEGKVLKVIIETCLLTDLEKVKACELAVEAKADFVKTSTGFSKGGAIAADVALMKRVVDGKALVKASGGIRDYAVAMDMINAGADRLGTSRTVDIVKGKTSSV